MHCLIHFKLDFLLLQLLPLGITVFFPENNSIKNEGNDFKLNMIADCNGKKCQSTITITLSCFCVCKFIFFCIFAIYQINKYEVYNQDISKRTIIMYRFWRGDLAVSDFFLFVVYLTPYVAFLNACNCMLVQDIICICSSILFSSQLCI